MSTTSTPTQGSGARAAPSSARARVFGAYELLSPLAEGGMGVVWLARRRGEAAQGFCAVKTVLRALSSRPSFLARFKDEARVVVTLNHRALCHVFDVGVVDGESYLAMELVEGATLARLVKALQEAGEAMPVEVALEIADEVGDALAHIHERRDPVSGAPLHIVHRDISPQNILVTFQGGVKVVDFGVVSSSLRQERTEAGQVIGKLLYMAPEQARGEPAVPATDVYSAAVVLYELVTGRRFWGELDKGVVMMELVDGTWRPPLDDVPAPLRPVLQAALEPDPARRLPDGAALQAALAAVSLPRAGPRALRALAARRLAPEQARLAALMQGASAVVVEAAPEATSITRLATAPLPPSSADDAVAGPTATTPARSLRRASSPPPRRAGIALGVGLGSCLLVVGAWGLMRDAHPTPPVVVAPAPSPPPPATTAVVAPPQVTPAPAPAAPPPAAPSSTPTPTSSSPPPPAASPPASSPPASSPPATDPPRSGRPRPSSSSRPPAEALPDLGAQLDYLARWCLARTSCAPPLVAERRRLGVLDAAALRALRDEAGRCVARCRR